MAHRIILGVQVTNRVENIPAVQKILSDYGCNIKTRLGLHEVTDSVCSTIGLLLLETYGDETEILKMEAKLKKIKGLVVKKMTFQQ
ncbi:MAG: hypothetical protein L7F78_23685 [Syntrophales bacterium LBB04]|nr:hypothetical protein [Syntrophales bacterium LBB04]